MINLVAGAGFEPASMDYETMLDPSPVYPAKLLGGVGRPSPTLVETFPRLETNTILWFSVMVTLLYYSFNLFVNPFSHTLTSRKYVHSSLCLGCMVHCK